MIPKEIDGDVWERMFAKAKPPFSREDIIKVADMRHSPVDVNEMTSIGLFELKDGSWGAIVGKYNPTYDEVLEADSFHCPARMKEILFSFYEDEKKIPSLQTVPT